jgi:sporulation protein YlmC with PRC-barrel domain
MARMASKSLIGRSVVSDRGTVVGTLKDLSIETVSGKVITLIVHPDKGIDIRNFKANENGDILLPFSAVKAVRDVLIVTEGGIPRA